MFPLVLRVNYSFYEMKMMGCKCILAAPKEELGLIALRQQCKRIEQLANERCVLYLTKMNYYAKEKMIEEGIAFVLEDRQIYIPFLGVFLQKKEVRDISICSKISFLSQKVLLTALYEGWDDMRASEIAQKMNVSQMSITRVFDEIEYLNIPVLSKRNGSRRYSKYGTKKEIWENIEPFMRNPLLKEFILEEKIEDDLMKSGISGLAELSMLEDNTYPTYAITKYEVRKKGILQKRQIPREENPGCMIQELGYCIPFHGDDVIDPLTIYLLLRDAEDPRVGMALEEMLEEYVW